MLHCKLEFEDAEQCFVSFGYNRVEPRTGIDGFFYVPYLVLELPDLPTAVRTILESAPQEPVGYLEFEDPEMPGEGGG